MKYIVFVLSMGLLLISCSKDNVALPTPINNGGNTGNLKFSGTFNGQSGYVANGTAKIFGLSGNDTLRFENFSSSNGPDLKVYLSKTNLPNSIINLGALKATSGNQFYLLPNAVDFTQYKYVLIHCQQFNKLFAVAELKP